MKKYEYLIIRCRRRCGRPDMKEDMKLLKVRRDRGPDKIHTHLQCIKIFNITSSEVNTYRCIIIIY